MRTSKIWLMAALVALAFSARQARADGDTASISGCSACNGYSFTASIGSTSSGTYNVSYTITNNTGAAASPYNWSLTSFDNSNSVSSATVGSVTLYNADGSIAGVYTGDYQAYAGKSNNGNSNCNGSISNAFCVQQTGTGTMPVLQQGQYLVFNLTVDCSNCGLMSSWDFMGSGNPTSGKGNVYAITNWGTATSMPEPSVLALYGSTLAAGLVVAWRSRVSRRSPRS
jgi:hypothetical protein